MNPSGITCDAAGNVYVVEQLYPRVQVFSPDGIHEFEWLTLGWNDGSSVGYPFGVAVGPLGSVFVADSNGNWVEKYTAIPTSVRPTTWGRLKSAFGVKGLSN